MGVGGGAAGNRLQKRLLESVYLDGETTGGYPTYFDHCTPGKMATLYREAGFEDIDLTIFYSPTPYFRVFVRVHIAMVCFMRLCRALGLSYFSSGFIVSEIRPPT